MKKKIVPIIALLIVLLDQASKSAVRLTIPEGSSAVIIPGLFHLTHIENSGATWGLFKGQNLAFIAISILVLGYFIHSWSNLPKPYFAMGLVFGGIIGNLLDRIILGGVTDFLDFRFWPVFNAADSSISLAIAIFVFYGLKEEITSRIHKA